MSDPSVGKETPMRCAMLDGRIGTRRHNDTVPRGEIHLGIRDERVCRNANNCHFQTWMGHWQYFQLDGQVQEVSPIGG